MIKSGWWLGIFFVLLIRFTVGSCVGFQDYWDFLFSATGVVLSCSLAFGGTE